MTAWGADRFVADLEALGYEPVKNGNLVSIKWKVPLGSHVGETVEITVLRGKQNVVESVLVCLLAHGHLLLEDKPGLGKTTLSNIIAKQVTISKFGRMCCRTTSLSCAVLRWL